MADFTGPSDPLVNTLLQEKHTFWINNSNLSEDERHYRWGQRAAQICSILGVDSTIPRRGPHAVPTRQQPQVPRSLSFGGSSMIREPTNRELPQAIDRPRDLSQQSAPAAVSMSRTASRSSRTGTTPFTSHGGFVSPLSTSSHGIPLSEWPAVEDDPFSAYTFRTGPSLGRTASQRNTLPQLSEVEVYEDPSTYVSQLSESLPAAPSLAFTPSPTVGRPNRRNQNPHRLSVSSDHTQFGNFFEHSHSPSTPTTGELTNGTTLISEMSRQDSTAGSSFCGGFDMLKVHSNMSGFDVNGEQSPVDCAQSFASKGDRNVALAENDRSHLLRFAGGVGEGVSYPQSFPSTNPSAVTAPVQSSIYVSEDMRRSLSNESIASTSSSQSSRFSQRRQEQLVQGTRPIAPKLSDDEGVMSRQSSEQNMLRGKSIDGSSNDKLGPLPKTNYVRPSHPKVMCKLCNEHPEGFRGEHELRRHTDRAHKKIRKAWVTVDITEYARKSSIECPKVPLANCKACRKHKHYGAYYNAAAHLRRAHFNPRKRGRGSKGKDEEKRGGKGGGEKPPMDELKKWMREVVEFVDSDCPPRGDDEADEQHDEELIDDSYPFAQTEIPYNAVSNSEPFLNGYQSAQSFDSSHFYDNSNTNILLPTSSIDNHNVAHQPLLHNSPSLLFPEQTIAATQQSTFDMFEPLSFQTTSNQFVDPSSFPSSFAFDAQQQQDATAALDDPNLFFLGMQQ
ncbi:MAG: hypothetical protein M1812_006235 [Candelaria pacifica]|nr:MAG: hypothetical protein M1812_006235 [Candelaria pacifica]